MNNSHAAIDYLGTLTNLSLSLSVTVYGAIAWLTQARGQHEAPFRRRAYLCWWLSWLAWVIAWLIILASNHYYPQEVPLRLKSFILLADNLNSLFLILTFLVLTGGNDFGAKEILSASGRLAGSLGLASAIVYALSPWLSWELAWQVHRTWALCLGIVAPVLVGWAVNLRFNVWLPLAIGFVYGFIQPIVYDAELNPTLFKEALHYKPVISMTLAGLKVTWALVFMQVLVNCGGDSQSLIARKPLPMYHAFKKWNGKLLGQAFLLGFVYLALLIVMLTHYTDATVPLATALTIAAGLITIIDVAWRLLDRLHSDQTRSSTKPESRNAATTSSS